MKKYSPFILYLLLTVLVVILYANGVGPLDSAQRSINDLLCALTADDTQREHVVTVTIDPKTQARFGEWPWNRDLIADLVAATAAGEPKALVLSLDLSEDTRQDSAGYTGILAGQLSWIKNVVLPYDIALAAYRSNVTSNPDYLFNYSVTIDNPLGLMADEAAPVARKTFLPAEKLLATAPALGFDYIVPDNDRILRRQPLVAHYEGYYYPNVSLIAAAAYLGVKPSEIRVVENTEIQVGNLATIPINERSECFLSFPPTGSIKNYSAADVLSDDFNRAQLNGKLVLIGLDDLTSRETFQTPITDAASKLQVQAAVAENIVNQYFLTVQRNPGMSMLILFAAGALFAFLLPQVPLMYRVVILLIGMVLLINANYFMVSSFRLLPETVYLALQLCLFLLAAPMLDTELIRGEAPPKRKDLDKLDSLSLGERRKVKPEELAMAPVREVRSNVYDAENAATSVLDVNDAPPSPAKQRQHDRADAMPTDHSAINIDSPLDLGASSDTAFLDSDSDLNFDEPITPSSATIISPEKASSSDHGFPADPNSGACDTNNQTPTGNIPPNLGRYRISGKLGKGAMGIVYRGVDPAINRAVALKTIRLDFVNDPEELAELKERLYREAQAAGKLSHPNIVTIYDVGSEGPLQYIAMEYLEGVTLEDMIKKKTKFNYRIIAEIIMQICSALQYAHEQGIVHRDIKPANIMVLRDYRVKVMDYGIARIDTSSMTKTGIAMGTPNYISPEQLKGQKSDHRADIFSLGVVMYEMLLGRRPFKGENITSLIYAIINQEPDQPSDVNPQIPLLFDHIIMKALKKDPMQRYQRAAEIAVDLKDFAESFASGS